eukprot:COSAG05_NODE_684_length_7947_cov_117.612603_2_plen_359_part_00
MMQPVTSSNRAFSYRQQSTHSLSGEHTYYRVHLYSLTGRLQYEDVDGPCLFEFDVSNVFPPTARNDQLGGTWEVFVEEWVPNFSSLDISNASKLDGMVPRRSIRLCLPNLVRGTQDFTTTREHDLDNQHPPAQRSDQVCVLPLDYEYVQRSDVVVPEDVEYPDVDFAPPLFTIDVASTAASSDAFTATTAADVHKLQVGMSVYFEGTAFGDRDPNDNSEIYKVGEVYYVISIDTSAGEFQLSGAVAGQTFRLADGNNSGTAGTLTLRSVAYQSRAGYTIPKPVLTYVNRYHRFPISVDSVGVQIDPSQLMQGKIQVLLRDELNEPIMNHPHTSQPHGGYMGFYLHDEFQVTLVFVHKP